MGAVKKPGAFALPADPHVTVYEALEQAGGIYFPGENPRLDEYEAEVAKLRVQLTKLNKVKDSDEAIEVAAGLGLEWPTIKESLPKYHQAKLELTQLLDKGLGNKHPSVVAARGQVANLKKDLENAVEGLKRTLDTKIQIAEAGLQSLKESAQNQAPPQSSENPCEAPLRRNSGRQIGGHRSKPSEVWRRDNSAGIHFLKYKEGGFVSPFQHAAEGLQSPPPWMQATINSA